MDLGISTDPISIALLAIAVPYLMLLDSRLRRVETFLASRFGPKKETWREE